MIPFQINRILNSSDFLLDQPSGRHCPFRWFWRQEVLGLMEMGLSWNGATPSSRRMVHVMENPTETRMILGFPYFRKPPKKFYRCRTSRLEALENLRFYRHHPGGDPFRFLPWLTPWSHPTDGGFLKGEFFQPWP